MSKPSRVTAAGGGRASLSDDEETKDRGMLTDNLIAFAARPARDLPPPALALARLSLFDWLACGLAGAGEPVAEKLRAFAAAEGGAPAASVIASGSKAPARLAALANGTTSHALDYDDTHFGHVGHLSVAVYPAALAVGELTDASAEEVVAAFLIGAESAVRIGRVLGAAHYDLGFHQTATAGAFGAALAAGRLLGLDPGQLRAALGLCASRAAGLKCQFGTMGKPLNAGIAAAAGVECAQLAALGVTSADDGLMGPQGFVATHAPQPDPAAGWSPPPDERFTFLDNKYKLHACCHGTHAMIEALLAAPELKNVGLEAVAGVTLKTNPRWLKVCDIKRPRSGLEVKFSYAWLAGMVLRGDATGDDRLYSDALAADPVLADLAARVTVDGCARLADLEAEGEVALKDGRRVAVSHDLAAPLPPAELAAKLRAKAEAAIGARAAEIWDGLADLGSVSARDIGGLLRGSRRPTDAGT